MTRACGECFPDHHTRFGPGIRVRLAGDAGADLAVAGELRERVLETVRCEEDVAAGAFERVNAAAEGGAASGQCFTHILADE